MAYLPWASMSDAPRPTGVEGQLRPLDIRRDLDGLGELVQITFEGELAQRGLDFREELHAARRLVPFILVLSRFSDAFRHLLDGFVWEVGGRIVASVTAQRLGGDPTRWVIGTVATHPDYRRRGLARTLVIRAMDHAASHGGEVCMLDVKADNRPAYALYRSLGFVQYDSMTELRLDKLPAVEAKPAPGYRLRPMQVGEWRARYELALRETPHKVEAYLPVSEAEWRVSPLMQLLAPLLNRLQGAEMRRWAGEQDGSVVGMAYLAARRVAGRTHELSLTIDPAHRRLLGEPLLTLALKALHQYPYQPTLVSLRTSYTDLLALLEQYGFIPFETTHRLGTSLNGPRNGSDRQEEA